MTKMMGLAAAALLSTAAASQAAVLANWTFETSVPTTAGPFAAEGGTLAATSFASSNTGGTFSNPVGNGTPESFSSNGWDVGEYYQFTTTAPGSTELSLAFDQISSSTGPGSFGFSYSIDGVTFSTPTAYTVLVNTSPNVWSASLAITASSYAFTTTGLASIPAATPVTFRLVDLSTTAAGGATVAATGTSRVDNVVVSDVVPEPTTLAALAGAALVAVGRRRR